ncbi:MAG: bifunctional phosphoribosylaminoimidazolecarboxamide formyltransferase/IMP cyclohydrolase [Flavobacteriales bacterium]|nr:MAG: bifunctional phosphoribosylaminoimidazolecarboxamide formyltransferase/IMP cyclohydrolase [Flavobacteriales bacterium]
MDGTKRITSALLSVYQKDGLEPIVRSLHRLGVHLYSTGGTQEFIERLGIPVTPVEELTTYPSILGGRVKTLHPKVFGGILGRRGLESDVAQLEEYSIPPIDLVVVDLYPFEATVAAGGTEEAIIEKIDIGGISLIRAAAKNHNDVVIVPSMGQYPALQRMLDEGKGTSTLAERKQLAAAAFAVSSSYDGAIQRWFTGGTHVLRYGENPHQPAAFHGDLRGMFEQLNGKDLSYNNLLDLDSAVELVDDLATLPGVPFAILKHNNACGAALRPTVKAAWDDALAGDPVSAFGGVLITTAVIDKITAEAIDTIFFEIICAPGYNTDALEVLRKKKNRIILVRKPSTKPARKLRTALNGVLEQAPDAAVDGPANMSVATKKAPTAVEMDDLVFANILVKHTKSNAIVLAKNRQLLASGTGQTSRVDALEQAIAKAGKFNFDLKGAVMASDAFFPFPDCVTIAHAAGITAIVQPGGSIKDNESIAACDAQGQAMVITGNRHFKH